MLYCNCCPSYCDTLSGPSGGSSYLGHYKKITDWSIGWAHWLTLANLENGYIKWLCKCLCVCACVCRNSFENYITKWSVLLWCNFHACVVVYRHLRIWERGFITWKHMYHSKYGIKVSQVGVLFLYAFHILWIKLSIDVNKKLSYRRETALQPV